MIDLQEIDNFTEIFKSNTPLLDVRAPIEFSEGSFPYAHNYPIMSDIERHQIGICYKTNGQDSAIKLGHELVHGNSGEHHQAMEGKTSRRRSCCFGVVCV